MAEALRREGHSSQLATSTSGTFKVAFARSPGNREPGSVEVDRRDDILKGMNEDFIEPLIQPSSTSGMMSNTPGAVPRDPPATAASPGGGDDSDESGSSDDENDDDDENENNDEDDGDNGDRAWDDDN